MPDFDDEQPKSPLTTPEPSKPSSPKPMGRKTSTPKTPQPPKPAQKLPKPPKVAKTFRFTPMIDIELLKLVLDQQPFAAGYGRIRDKWQAVTDALKVSLTRTGEALPRVRDLIQNLPETTVRRRFDTLIDSFKKKEMDSLRASGTDEQCAERERLLIEILEMIEVHELEKAEAQKKEGKGKAIVMAAAAVKTGGKRKNANEGDMENGDDESSDIDMESKDGWLPASSSSRRKRQRSDISTTSSTAAILLKYFEQQDKLKIADHAFEERKLLMEERRLYLAEKKFEEMKAERLYKEEKERADRKEREEKDRAERKAREEKDQRLMESQNALIQTLLSLIAKKV
ncbi:hypothetical protein BC829DRAFT_432721 [Chytridium lagenaria]|nr:hypothetical protein BC829DRAFT_432721 [Chytridium lagenaria]